LRAALQAGTEVFRIEMVGAGDLDFGYPPFDGAKGDDAVDDVLIRDQEARVDVALVDVEQRQLPADLLEIRSGQRLADIRLDHAAYRRLVESGVADDCDVAQYEAWTLGQRRL